MSIETKKMDSRSLNAILFDIESLKSNSGISYLVTAFLDGDYKAVLRDTIAQTLFSQLRETIALTRAQQDAALQNSELCDPHGAIRVFITGLAAFNTFLQANVTGPPLDLRDVLETSPGLKEQCLKSLDVDGMSVYQYIPHVELFCLARLVFTVYFPRIISGDFKDCKWMRVRVNAFHQRLLSGMAGSHLSDSTRLQDFIEKDLLDLEKEVLGERGFSTEAKCMFLLEKAQIYIMQGLDFKARENVRLAKTVAGFSYELSGALGRRTKFQQTDISQLVVFAKSRDDVASEYSEGALKENKSSNGEGGLNGNAPKALDLNDDTLLESIEFSKPTSDLIENSALPPHLASMQPDDQPQLKPLDQITLLTEATLKDALSPMDKLNTEEILPYAVRVLADKPTNWQIYTQALLVRSRIESHRSRTQERSVLQLQVIVDQIIANTQEESPASSDGIPEIRITQFLPRAKGDESAPVYERLKYIYQLNTPTRWEIETELAYAWSGAGSLVSALEIFKRLRLWPEVALCFHSVGQEDKARQIVRRQLYHSSKGPEMDQYSINAEEVIAEKWDGEIRSPPPPHSPRLWCILGDLDDDPESWLRAWEISNHRYARAQRTLGEHYSKLGDLVLAREAYMKATVVSRQNNETWSRLGDIDLAVGNWDGAIVAFQQSIMIDDDDAKTYSNLGSALLSKHAELLKLQKAAAKDITIVDNDEEEIDFSAENDKAVNPRDILRQALTAYKKGASLAHDNWKIWDNVVTIAGRMSPPSFPELLMGLRAVIRIRGPAVGEHAVDADVLRGLVSEVISRERPENTLPGANEGGVYTPPRGSLARATIDMVDVDVVPLITKRAELWALVEKLCLYRKDYRGALECAEKAWRVAGAGEKWLLDEEAWRGVVAATDNLVSAYENYGPQEKMGGGEVEKSWRMKARSAVRGTMGKARDVWDETAEWRVLEERLEELNS